ncbi:hypothetical protein KGY73_03275 [bacterium]|nr:hypothetical protein [bacterium]
MAFLGYGASGSFLSIFKKITHLNRNKFLCWCAFFYSLTIFSSYLLCNHLSFDFTQISWNNNQIFFILIYYLLFSLPFFFAGTIISFAITTTTKAVNKIYFSDLIGSGIGTLGVLIIFLPKGDKGVILLISFLPLIAALLFSPRRSHAFRGLTGFLLVGGIVLFFQSPDWLSFRISPYKALPSALRYSQSKHLLTKWNAQSRVDVIDSPAVRYAPGLSLLYQKKLPSQLGLTIDGGSLTAITRFDPSKPESLKFLSYLPSSLAYSFKQNPQTLLLNPKGGLDLLEAVHYNASSIKAVENNPLIIEVLQDELSSFYGNLYRQENLHVTSSHLRSALKKESRNYELVVFSLTDVFGSSGTGLYGFGENYLYTKESFLNVLERLSPKGIVSMSFYLLPPPRQELRALATWVEALEKKDKAPSTHLMALRSWGTLHYFIKNTPFNQEEIQKLKEFSDKYLFDLVHYPGIKKNETNIHNQFNTPLYYNRVQKLLSPKKREKFYSNYLFQIRPVTDNSPFFYNFFKINKLKKSFKALNQKLLPFLRGRFLVHLLLVQAIIIAFVLILLPLFVLKKRGSKKGKTFVNVFFYFGLIGMAFMFVEITLIQKFILFLGHPIYSTSIIIFSLLLSSGLGSFFSRKILSSPIQKNLKKFLLLCGGVTAAYLFLLPLFTQSLIGLGLTLKILLTFLVIFPLGFLMGFPFPNGIRLVEKKERKFIPWAWAVNAFSSVINSVAALLLAFWGGYNLVFILAAGGYLLTVPFLSFSDHRNKPHS